MSRVTQELIAKEQRQLIEKGIPTTQNIRSNLQELRGFGLIAPIELAPENYTLRAYLRGVEIINLALAFGPKELINAIKKINEAAAIVPTTELKIIKDTPTNRQEIELMLDLEMFIVELKVRKYDEWADYIIGNKGNLNYTEEVIGQVRNNRSVLKNLKIKINSKQIILAEDILEMLELAIQKHKWILDSDK